MTTARKIVQVIPATKSVAKLQKSNAQKLKIAAYCRVSTMLEEQEGSYETQVEYYTQKINDNPDWKLVKIYADQGKSATRTEKRDSFNEMIADCMDGKIDMILTKAISRFSRNTVDALENIRKLKEKGIPILFEKEGINTMDSGGELLLTILSSQAQEESRSISENTRWGIVRKFEQGIPTMHMKTLFGYAEAEDGGVIIEESEAEIVRFMYKKYLDGWSGNRIAKELEVREIKTSTGKSKWNSTTILSMLQNEKYCGDCLLQKTYTVDYLTKKRSKNRGECDVFYVENHHVPIVEKAIFQDVQTEIYRRKSARKGSVKKSKKGNGKDKNKDEEIEIVQNLEVVETKSYTSKYVLTELLKCDCGHSYKRKLWTLADGQEAVWRCSEKLKNGSKSNCKSPMLKEIPLHRAIMKVIQGYTSQKMEIKAIYEQIEGFEKEILELNQRSVTEGKLDEKYHRRIVELTKEIADLREKKKQAIEQEKLNKKKSNRKDKVEEVLTKVSKLESTKFDEELVWRVVQKIIVKQNRMIEILFFTGFMVEVEVEKK